MVLPGEDEGIGPSVGWRIFSSSSSFQSLPLCSYVSVCWVFFLLTLCSPLLSFSVRFLHFFSSVFCLVFLLIFLRLLASSPLPFISFYAVYPPMTMIRPGDIVFQSDWGTENPTHVGLPFISMRAWEIYPYLPGVVIFTKIRFAKWVLVGLGCWCFNISIPSL